MQEQPRGRAAGAPPGSEQPDGLPGRAARPRRRLPGGAQQHHPAPRGRGRRGTRPSCGHAPPGDHAPGCPLRGQRGGAAPAHGPLRSWLAGRGAARRRAATGRWRWPVAARRAPRSSGSTRCPASPALSAWRCLTARCAFPADTCERLPAGRCGGLRRWRLGALSAFGGRETETGAGPAGVFPGRGGEALGGGGGAVAGSEAAPGGLGWARPPLRGGGWTPWGAMGSSSAAGGEGSSAGSCARHQRLTGGRGFPRPEKNITGEKVVLFHFRYRSILKARQTRILLLSCMNVNCDCFGRYHFLRLLSLKPEGMALDIYAAQPGGPFSPPTVFLPLQLLHFVPAGMS